MNEPLVTIYTQAYNVENYIRECVESVLNQTYRNFEWILIENGSTDSTREIILEYAQKDKRIKLVRFSKNTRGFGNDVITNFSRGKYIAKLDSDDYWDSRYLEKMVGVMEEEEVDLVCCETLVLDEVDGGQHYYGPNRIDRMVTQENFAEQYCEIQGYIDTYWAKLMKRDLFIKAYDMQTEFYKNRLVLLGWGGDTVFMYCYLHECHTFRLLKDVLHFYRLHKNNFTRTVADVKALENCQAALDIKKSLLQKFHAWNEENVARVYEAFWGSIDKFLRNIIQSNMDNRQKIERMGLMLSDARVLEKRGEYMPDNARTILKTHMAWCYVNMQEGCEGIFWKMLVVLEPTIFSGITEEQYQFLLAEKTLLPLIIMGEKEEAARYLQGLQMEAGGADDEILERICGTWMQEG